MHEMARVLKQERIGIITATASFGVVFTDGTSQEKVMNHIQKVIENIKD